MAIRQLDSPSIPHVRSAHSSGRTRGSRGAKDTQLNPASPKEAVPSQVKGTDMEQALATLNKLVAPAAQAIEFSIDNASGKTVVQVIDIETHKVLRQMPNEEALAISRAFDELKGLLIHHEA
jgi:flagellar protein FlaG